jgi:hypothetical protein
MNKEIIKFVILLILILILSWACVFCAEKSVYDPVKPSNDPRRFDEHRSSDKGGTFIFVPGYKGTLIPIFIP